MVKINYLWDEVSDNVIAEYESGVATAVYTQEPELYGNLISQRRSGVSRFYHFDARGDTRNLTDASENVTDSTTYDAWGNVIASTGSTPTPFRFVARMSCQSEPSAMMTYVRELFVQTSIARWTGVGSPDFLNAMNSFPFVANDPLPLESIVQDRRESTSEYTAVGFLKRNWQYAQYSPAAFNPSIVGSLEYTAGATQSNVSMTTQSASLRDGLLGRLIHDKSHSLHYDAGQDSFTVSRIASQGRLQVVSRSNLYGDYLAPADVAPVDIGKLTPRECRALAKKCMDAGAERADACRRRSFGVCFALCTLRFGPLHYPLGPNRPCHACIAACVTPYRMACLLDEALSDSCCEARRVKCNVTKCWPVGIRWYFRGCADW